MDKLDTIFEHFLQYRLVSTDSRNIVPNCIFFALSGKNFNGNLFAEEALEKGASYAVVDQELNSQDHRLIRVTSTLEALQQFATRYRLLFPIPVIAITGSNGKTTNKELISTVLSANFNVHYTKGNFNNHIGVPLTLLQLSEDHEIAVIEMGANHQLEIAELCQIARPSHGLITNIGKAHLEGFGGIEGVKKGKGELFDYLLQSSGIVFANRSEESLLDLLQRKGLRTVAYSNSSKDSGFVDLISTSDNASLSFEVQFFDNEKVSISTQLQGKYNLLNIINAICIGIYFRVPSSKIVAQIESYQPTNNRSQLKIVDSNKFILDAYNANPSSMKAAIENFSKIDHPYKIAILGEMYELGEFAEIEHENIADLATSLDIHKAIFVGPLFPKPDFNNVDELLTWFKNQEFQNAYFLVKGSRGVALEKIFD